ncbi:aromatic ring-hydroxylating dioxygenase subunit alpha [Pusillimonas caeni]|uniref:aromatic ring-hydroxylating dioxygenase subunit alpha n=1 Tax=Pusillimonas caeni TaxID=1348472 RepID=UPI000E59E874|nr:aromatic ring-hydroxylating dioxygenase subunit alpha [Pusillimonas caeni]TFL14683.1 aromatic ring-hydroxylating dioxygenase subunit alpha [Pusillimonas caeni]
MFPKNTWYVAARSEEVEAKPLGRQICGEKIAFYRGLDNKVCAVEDFCPHRGAALSLGYVEAGNLVCGYHGLVMGCDGKPVSMPMQRIQGFPCIKSYPVVERYGFLWVWPGEAEKAQESLVPTFEWCDNRKWVYDGGLYHIGCDYRLMIDNLMDLTHEAYVHAGSIGQPEIDLAPVNTTTDGDMVITSRYMNNIIAPPHWQAALRANGLPDQQPVDRWQVSRFTPPSHIMIDVGVALAGKGGYEADPQYKASSTVVDFITPETETSHWYFWGMARNYKIDDAALTEAIREDQGRIFHQDLDVLEAQQRNIQSHPDRKLLMLNIDTGGVQARRIIDKMIRSEREEAMEEA